MSEFHIFTHLFTHKSELIIHWDTYTVVFKNLDLIYIYLSIYHIFCSIFLSLVCSCDACLNLLNSGWLNASLRLPSMVYRGLVGLGGGGWDAPLSPSRSVAWDRDVCAVYQTLCLRRLFIHTLIFWRSSQNTDASSSCATMLLSPPLPLCFAVVSKGEDHQTLCPSPPPECRQRADGVNQMKPWCSSLRELVVLCLAHLHRRDSAPW